MDKRARTAAIGGGCLVVLGALLLLIQISPPLSTRLAIVWSWPMMVVAVGVTLLVIGLLTGSPGMAVPAFVVGGIGGILYWQTITGNWFSWAYAWALIPGFVGIGMILQALLGQGGWRQILRGAEAILNSLILFVIFGSLFGGLTLLGPYWPALLIIVGVVQLVRRIVRPFPASAVQSGS